MKKIFIIMLILACSLNFFGCKSDNSVATPEILLVDESTEYMKELFKATAPKDIIQHLLPEVDKVKDENKATWAAELIKNCSPVEINIHKEEIICRIKAIPEGLKKDPKFEPLRNYTRDSCSKLVESVSKNCVAVSNKILEALYKPAEFGGR